MTDGGGEIVNGLGIATISEPLPSNMYLFAEDLKLSDKTT